MVTYIQGLLNSDVFKELDGRVVRFDYLNKERFRGVFRIVVNLINTVFLTVVFICQTLSWRPDIVHIQTNSGFGYYEKSWLALLAKLMGRRTLLHVHGGNFRLFYQDSPPILQNLIRKCALISNRIVTASPQMRDNFLFIGIPEAKITQIGNAVNLPDIHKDYQPGTQVTILFLTRIVLAKGIIELIDAVTALFGSNEGIQLRIVGAEELETVRVKDYLEKIGKPGYIRYVGPVSEAQKHHEYLSADIFAFPTHVEDQSYAVMEAMSYGLPCIASNVGGVPSLIRDGQNGLLINPKDVPSLKAALENLVRDPELRRRLGMAARRTIADEFSWANRAAEMKRLYDAVLRE
jgi:glycosyltransferase involved in cell wall biosynthesis